MNVSFSSVMNYIKKKFADSESEDSDGDEIEIFCEDIHFDTQPNFSDQNMPRQATPPLNLSNGEQDSKTDIKKRISSGSSRSSNSLASSSAWVNDEDRNMRNLSTSLNISNGSQDSEMDVEIINPPNVPLLSSSSTSSFINNETRPPRSISTPSADDEVDITKEVEDNCNGKCPCCKRIKNIVTKEQSTQYRLSDFPPLANLQCKKDSRRVPIVNVEEPMPGPSGESKKRKKSQLSESSEKRMRLSTDLRCGKTLSVKTMTYTCNKSSRLIIGFSNYLELAFLNVTKEFSFKIRERCTEFLNVAITRIENVDFDRKFAGESDQVRLVLRMITVKLKYSIKNYQEHRKIERVYIDVNEYVNEG